jgi:hypothetical protein
MSDAVYHRKLARVLDRMGGVYLPQDILARIADGRMQSFAHRNSWLITEVNQFPRALAMDWIAAVGDLDDWRILHHDAIRFADRNNVSLIRAYGRRGWFPLIRDHGWRRLTVNQVYLREL